VQRNQQRSVLESSEFTDSVKNLKVAKAEKENMSMGKDFRVSSTKKSRKEKNKIKRKQSIGRENAADDPEVDSDSCARCKATKLNV
jgi:hypothetical protein